MNGTVSHRSAAFATEDALQSNYHTTNGKLKDPKSIWESTEIPLLMEQLIKLKHS
jgi:hypothetical protein